MSRKARKKRIVRFWYNGFHGRAHFALYVPVDAEPGELVCLSSAVARRVNHVCCPVSKCLCGERLVQQHPDGQWFITLPADGDTVRGRYPQT